MSSVHGHAEWGPEKGALRSNLPQGERSQNARSAVSAERAGPPPRTPGWPETDGGHAQRSESSQVRSAEVSRNTHWMARPTLLAHSLSWSLLIHAQPAFKLRMVIYYIRHYHRHWGRPCGLLWDGELGETAQPEARARPGGVAGEQPDRRRRTHHTHNSQMPSSLHHRTRATSFRTETRDAGASANPKAPRAPSIKTALLSWPKPTRESCQGGNAALNPLRIGHLHDRKAAGGRRLAGGNWAWFQERS
jgi:hypothetical protein